MSFPNYLDKHLNKALFSPGDFLEFLRSSGKYPNFTPPEGLIFCYQKSLLDFILKNHKVEKLVSNYGDFYTIPETKEKVAILGKFGIGAPVVTTAFEELIAFGVKKFISIGTAGALQNNIAIGDIVVCDSAIRDEGVSYHYLAPSKFAHPSKSMTEEICQYLENNNIKYFKGPSWTIDAPYRETVEEIKKYQEEGIMTVEMEASALFSVAEYRNVTISALFTISDSLADLKWNPQFHSTQTSAGLELLYNIALEVLK